MSNKDLTALYRRFGPLLFSHFLEKLGDENQAKKATRYAFEELVTLATKPERELVQWIRNRETPVQVAQTESLY